MKGHKFKVFCTLFQSEIVSFLHSPTPLQCYLLLIPQISAQGPGSLPWPLLSRFLLRYFLSTPLSYPSHNYSFIYRIFRLIYLPTRWINKRRNIFSTGVWEDYVCVHTYLLFTQHSWLACIRSLIDICFNEWMFFIPYHAASKKNRNRC